MTTYNTGNPVPSVDVRDLYDNAENLDKLINGTLPSYPDRLGVSRKSWAGMEADFSAFLLASGYELIGDYDTDGPLLIERPNQVFTKDGEYWRGGPALTLPYTTVNNWVTDAPKFVSVGDAVLRQDLAAGTGSTLVGRGAGTVEDALDAIELSASRLNGSLVTLKSYGADDTGTANSVTEIQAALDSGASVVDGCGKTYRIDATVYLAGNQTLQNCKLDFSNAVSGAIAVRALGSVTGPYSIGTAAEGTVNFTFTTIGDAANFAAGDYLRLSAANVFDASNTNTKVGEINVVGAVNLGTGVISCATKRQLSYTSSPTVERLNFLKRSGLFNVEIVGATADENNQIAVQAEYASDFTVENCKFSRFDSRCVYFIDCIGGRVRGNSFLRARPTSSGYGVSFADATQDCSAIGNYFENVRHSLSTNNTSGRGGVVKRIVFADNNVYISAPALGGSMGGGDAIDTHGAAMDVTITGNTVYGATGNGINVECCGAVITGNTIGRSESNGISVHNESDRPGGFVVSNNIVRSPGLHGIAAFPPIRGASTLDLSFIVSGNTVANSAGVGIQIGSTTVGAPIAQNVDVTGNVIDASTSYGILCQIARGAVIVNNQVRNQGAAVNAIRISDVLQFSITGNVLRSLGTATASILQVAASTAGASARGVISSNLIETAGGTTTEMAVVLGTNAQYIGVWNNVTRGTGGINIGVGTGNVQANNIT